MKSVFSWSSLVAVALVAACSAPEPVVAPTLELEPLAAQRVKAGESLSYQVVAKAVPAAALTYALDNPPDGLAIDAAGLVSWTPTAGQAGIYFVGVTVSTGGTPPLVAHGRLDVVVATGNRAPVLDAVTAGSLLLAPGETTAVAGIAHDLDGDLLTWAFSFPDDSWTVSGEGAAAVVTAPKAFGAHAELTVKVSDPSGAEATKTLTLATRANTAPQLAPIVLARNPVARGGSVLAEAFAFDVDGGELTYTWSASDGFAVEPAGARATVTAPNVAGAEGTISVKVTDAAGAEATAEVVLRTAANVGPVVSSIIATPAAAARGGTVTVHVEAADQDGDALSYTWSPPAGWTGTSTTDTLVLHAPDAAGRSDALKVRVSDGDLAVNAEIVLATQENHAPQIDELVVGANPVTADTTTTIVASAHDADGDALTYAWTSSDAAWTITGTGETVQLKAPGIAPGATSTTKVTLTVTDASGAQANRSVWATAGLPPAIAGTVEYLSTTGLELDVNGTVVPVSAAGAFTTPVRVLPGAPFSVAVRSQPDGQSCLVKGGAGLALDGAAQAVKVVCSLSLKSTRTAVDPLFTDATAYADVPGLAPLTFRTSGAGKVLVTLSVPHVRADNPGHFSDAWFDVEVDGQVAGETAWQSAVWGQGGPVALAAVADVTTGDHEVKARWKYGGHGAAGAAVVLEPLGEVQLTATVLDSLSQFDRVARASDAGGRSTLSSTWEALGTLSTSLDLDAGQPVLLSMQVPYALAPGGQTTDFRVRSGAAVLGETHFRHEGSHRAGTIFGFDQPSTDGVRAWDAEWNVSSASEGAATAEGTLQLSAFAFKPSAKAFTSVKLDAAAQANGSDAAIDGLAPVTFTLARRAQVLLAFQAAAMSVDGNGPSGLVSLLADGNIAGKAHVQSQNSNWSAPVPVITVVDLPAGAHTISAAWRANNPGYAVRLDAGVTRLSAIVLE